MDNYSRRRFSGFFMALLGICALALLVLIIYGVAVSNPDMVKHIMGVADADNPEAMNGGEGDTSGKDFMPENVDGGEGDMSDEDFMPENMDGGEGDTSDEDFMPENMDGGEGDTSGKDLVPEAMDGGEGDTSDEDFMPENVDGGEGDTSGKDFVPEEDNNDINAQRLPQMRPSHGRLRAGGR